LYQMGTAKIILLMVILGLHVGCVGPTSPLGPVSVNTEKTEGAFDPTHSETVFLHPPRKFYHHKGNILVEVQGESLTEQDIELKFYHNDRLVKSSLFKPEHIQLSANRRKWMYSIKDIRFKALDANKVRIDVFKNGKKVAEKYLYEPTCEYQAQKRVFDLSPFRAPASLTKMIQGVSQQSQINPALLSGLIAQESAFNPKAVSWAKAIGLTQVTSLAEQQIIEVVKEWPRDPNISELSYLTLKSKILMDEINADTEWRLDPEKSLLGGVAYLDYLKDYWSRSDNEQLYQRILGDDPDVFTDIVLASYNSGPARVKRALNKHQHMWKKDDQLKEAVRYLKKVKSFCFHSSYKGDEDDTET
jgi:hypothetical protein